MIILFLKQFQCTLGPILSNPFALQMFQESFKTKKEVLTSLSQSEQSPISSSSMLDKCLRNPKSEPGIFFNVVNDCVKIKEKKTSIMNFVKRGDFNIFNSLLTYS